MFTRGLYGILDVGLVGESSEAMLENLLCSGAPVVQLRWKGAAAGPMLEAARLLQEVCRRYGATSIVNDRADVAAAAGAGGVHLGQHDLTVWAARAVMPPGTVIGVSTHDLDQVEAALSVGADYIGFGPVFPTTTKEVPDPVVGLDLLGEVVNLVKGRVPVVAIGGITSANAFDVARAGADLAAVISDVLLANDAAGRARHIHEIMTARGAGQGSVA